MPRYELTARDTRRTPRSAARDALSHVMDNIPHIRATRARKRLAASVRQAALHATPGELVELDKLVTLAHSGNMDMQQALSHVAELRRTHDARRSGTVLRIVTMPQDKPWHDPAACTLMVCDHPACIGLNARRVGQGSGNADPFRRAA